MLCEFCPTFFPITTRHRRNPITLCCPHTHPSSTQYPVATAMRISAYLAVVVLSALFLYGLNASLDSPAIQHSHLLLMSDVAGPDWDRTLEGAQAAARDLGISLDIQSTPTSNTDPLRTAAQNLDTNAYNGIALSLAEPECNRDLVNDLADRTKVVTIGNDFGADSRRTHRLCHIGSHHGNIGIR